MKKGFCAGFMLFLLTFSLISVVRASSNKDEDLPKVKALGVSCIVKGLKPRHDYVVCINGYGGHKSNDVFVDMGQLWRPSGEGYCDLNSIMSDGDGNLDLRVTAALPAGPYRLKILLKDPEREWKVVWNKDDIKFEVVR